MRYQTGQVSAPLLNLNPRNVRNAREFRGLKVYDLFGGHLVSQTQEKYGIPGTVLYGIYLVVESTSSEGITLLANPNGSPELIRIRASRDFVPEFFDRRAIGQFGKDPKFHVDDTRTRHRLVKPSDPIFRMTLDSITDARRRHEVMPGLAVHRN